MGWPMEIIRLGVALSFILCLGESLVSRSEKAFFKVCSYPEEMGISLKASMDKKTESVRQSGHLRTVL